MTTRARARRAADERVLKEPRRIESELAGFALIAFAVTWLLVLPIGTSHQGWIGTAISGDWHFLGALGPLAGALIAARSRSARVALASAWSRWRASPWLYAAALSPLLFLGPAAVLVRLQEGAWPEVAAFADAERLTGRRWVMAMLVPAVAYAVGEETGWRGFALPRLQGLLTPFRATALLATVWVLWHAPFYLYRPGMEGAPPAEVVAQAVVIAIGAFFLTWLYNSSNGSVLLVALWHFTHSVVHIAVPEVSVSWETWSGVLSTVLAVVVMSVWRKGLATTGRPVTLIHDDPRDVTAPWDGGGARDRPPDAIVAD